MLLTECFDCALIRTCFDAALSGMDNPLRGIILMLGATMCFSCSDAMAKYLGQSLPVTEIIWIRYCTFVALAIGVFLRSGRPRLQVRSPAVQILRGLGLAGSAVFFVSGLRLLPMADAASINFVSPLMITLLAVPMLGEVVGLRRWLAIIVGLLGVLIVIRPGPGALQLGAGFVVLSSLCWAVGSVLTRRLASTDHAATTLLWSAVAGFVVLSLLLPLEFAWPSAWLLALTVMMGMVASSGQYLLVLAYRHAGAAVLAPFSYAQLLWSMTLGYAVFGALPDGWTVTGAAIIAGSGLYSANRERVQSQRIRAV
jgi:drug/metabolite transporter (DMT)-like permease